MAAGPDAASQTAAKAVAEAEATGAAGTQEERLYPTGRRLDEGGASNSVAKVRDGRG